MVGIKHISVIAFFCLQAFLSAGQGKQDQEKKALPADSMISLFLTDTSLQHAGIGIYVADALSGEILGAYQPELSLAPASVMKIVTTATALEILGDSFRFATRLEISGTIDKDGTLKGNVIITGGGDPALGSRFFKETYQDPFFMDVWADTLYKSGIRKIEGNILADASIYSGPFVPDSWAWSDIGNYYGAGASGLSVYDNQYNVTYNTGAKGTKARVKEIVPKTSLVTVDSQVLAGWVDDDYSCIYGFPYDTCRLITGEIPAGRKSFSIRGSLPEPPLTVALEFQRCLTNRGIGVTGVPRLAEASDSLSKAKRTVMITWSPPLKDIVRITNQFSMNLYAHQLLFQIGLKVAGKGTEEAGKESLLSFWKQKGLDTGGFFPEDGCGLSRANAVTAKFLAGVLLYMYSKSQNKESFIQSLPVAGKTGTLRNLMKGTVADGKIRAKSGYIGRVRSYAGYATNQSGRELVFVIMVNNYTCSPSSIKRKLEQFMIGLIKMKQFN
jgi:serine-type D-Ala-D-Ala carboxypeptidase/endopeptidase (penicillin-binding protein 4)